MSSDGFVKVIYACLDFESECKAGKMPTLNKGPFISFHSDSHRNTS